MNLMMPIPNLKEHAKGVKRRRGDLNEEDCRILEKAYREMSQDKSVPEMCRIKFEERALYFKRLRLNP